MYSQSIFGFESALLVSYSQSIQTKLFDTDRDEPYSPVWHERDGLTVPSRPGLIFILGCSPRVNEESESRWIIRFCFIKLEEKPFHSFHSSSYRERRESEIMIDYLSKKYNYMLQNGGKYHCHNRFHLSCGFPDHRSVELHRRGQKEVKRRSKLIERVKWEELFLIESSPIIGDFNN